MMLMDGDATAARVCISITIISKYQDPVQSSHWQLLVLVCSRRISSSVSLCECVNRMGFLFVSHAGIHSFTASKMFVFCCVFFCIDVAVKLDLRRHALRQQPSRSEGAVIIRLRSSVSICQWNHLERSDYYSFHRWYLFCTSEDHGHFQLHMIRKNVNRPLKCRMNSAGILLFPWRQ